MGVEEFTTWVVKRFLAVIIMTVGVDDILQVYFPFIKTWNKGKMTIRLFCFLIFSFLCSMVYDLKTWEKYQYLLETFAIAMGCVVFFFPIRSSSVTLIDGIIRKITWSKKDE